MLDHLSCDQSSKAHQRTVACLHRRCNLTSVSNICKAAAFIHVLGQRATKVVSDSPGLVEFATRLVNSVLNLPDKYFEEFNLQNNCEIISAHQKFRWGGGAS